MIANRRRLVIILLPILLVGSLLAIILCHLPTYLETHLIPRLARNLGLGTLTFQIRTLKITRMELVNLTLSRQDNSTFSVDSLRIEYALTDIIRGGWKIRVSATGFAFRAESGPGTIIIQAPTELKDAKKTGDIGKPDFQPEIHLEASGVGTIFSGSCHLGFSSLQIRLLPFRQHLTLSGLSGDIPFQWPPAGNDSTGSLSIESLQWERSSVGKLNATIHQLERGADITGQFKSSALPNLSIDFSADAGITEKGFTTECHVRLPTYSISESIDLGRFFKKAAGISLKGEFAFSADFAVGASCPSGSCSATIQEGQFTHDRTGLIVDGISTTLFLPDLFSFRSAPRQTLLASRLAIGNITATDFSADYQIESPDCIFIEQSRFNWCGGNIGTQAFRISPEAEEHHLTLYCDRLNLAEILRQSGAAQAEGMGTVNGRIPISFSSSQVIFDDGFLYSTPGDGGKIKLSDTGFLLAGLPPGSPELTQMEIAGEALKDFEYSWVKVHLGSQADALVMQLKFDGKPATPLPFRFEREIGRFIRVDANAQGSNFQGIRLDVNFRLPLDAVLKYKDLFNKTKRGEK